MLGSFDKNDMPTETTLLCDSIMDLIYDTKKEIYAKFRLTKIDGEEFTFIYNNADDENYGKFTVNINTLDVKPIKYAKADKGGSIWLTLIRKDFFADKFQKYKETRKIDGKTYTINGK